MVVLAPRGVGLVFVVVACFAAAAVALVHLGVLLVLVLVWCFIFLCTYVLTSHM